MAFSPQLRRYSRLSARGGADRGAAAAGITAPARTAAARRTFDAAPTRRVQTLSTRNLSAFCSTQPGAAKMGRPGARGKRRRLSAAGSELGEQIVRRGDLEFAGLLDVQRLHHAVLDDHGVALRAHAHAELRGVHLQPE